MDFEKKLKENLIKDIDETNADVIDAVMRTPFAETSAKRNFFSMPKRAVATICASVLLLCVGVFSSDLLSGQASPSDTPSTMQVRDYNMAMESASINVSESLQAVMLQADMSDIIEVAVVSNYTQDTFTQLETLTRELTIDDFTFYSATEETIFTTEITKSSIINMKDYFYFMLPSEI